MNRAGAFYVDRDLSRDCSVPDLTTSGRFDDTTSDMIAKGNCVKLLRAMMITSLATRAALVLVVLAFLELNADAGRSGGGDSGKSDAVMAVERPLVRHCGATRSKVCLVLTYEITTLLSGQKDVWFLDTSGNEFSYSPRNGRDALAESMRGGSVREEDFLELLSSSEPIGKPISQPEIRRIISLIVKSRNGPIKEIPAGCKDSSNIIIRGYWVDRKGHASQYQTLLAIRCMEVVFENKSSAAHEIIQWVYDHAGKVRAYGPPVVPPWHTSTTVHP
jgi:hypothetical protein